MSDTPCFRGQYRLRGGVRPAFSGMVQRSETEWQVVRLPVEDDPMLARIERIRNQEYFLRHH